jgi:hypothetical protein
MAGGDASGRVRAEEFEVSDLSAADLAERLDDVLAHSRGALESLTLDDLGVMRSASVFNDRSFSVAWSLAHALDHTALHAGHIELTRQLWDMRG